MEPSKCINPDCDFYGSEQYSGFCSQCKESKGVTAATQSGSKCADSSLFSFEATVPTQFDKYKLTEGQGNQCSWCAHEFANCANDLVAAAEAGDAGAFAVVYDQCMQRGSQLRQQHCSTGLALPVGENIDDPAILSTAKVNIVGDIIDPLVLTFKIIQSAPMSIFRQQREMLPMMFPALVFRIAAATDEGRHGANASRRNFIDALGKLPPRGVCIIERHVEAMTLIRTNDPNLLSDRAFLLCDSHYPRAGLTSLRLAEDYVFRLIPGAEFPLIYGITTTTSL